MYETILDEVASRCTELMYYVSQPWEFDEGYDTHEDAIKGSEQYVRECITGGYSEELIEEYLSWEFADSEKEMDAEQDTLRRLVRMLETFYKKGDETNGRQNSSESD